MTQDREEPVLTSQMNCGILHFREFSKPLIVAVIRDAGESCASENHLVYLQLGSASHMM